MTPSEITGSESYNKRTVKDALKRILASDQFASSAQLSSFLSYIVSEKLEGREQEIKAYSIAVDALGRPEDFDPQENAFVRVAAGRLRQALALYNASETDASDSIRITLEPGSYVPEFVSADEISISPQELEEFRAAEEVDFREPIVISKPQPIVQEHTFISKRWRLVVAGIGLAVLANLALLLYVVLRPAEVATNQVETSPTQLATIDIGVRPRLRAILVLPDKPYPDWLKIGELIESLSVVIARFDDYQFVAAKAVDNINEIEDETSIDYQMVLTAYRVGKNVRFFGKMLNVKSRSTIWSTERLFEPPEASTARNVPDIFGRIYSTVASPYGVLYANLANAPNQRTELSCVISGYQYFYSKTTEKHAAARTCAEKMVDRGTRLPSIYAMLTFLYLDEFRENRNRRSRDPLEAAVNAANRAVEFGPQSARAHQALFGVQKVRGHQQMARISAEKAIAFNPYDADIVGDYAAWLISIGDIKKGKEYLARVESMLDARPAWLEFYRFLGAELSNDFEAASDMSLMMDIRRAPLLAVAVAIGAGSRGDTDNARRALEELVRAEPGFRTTPMEQFLNRGFDRKVAQQLVDKLNAAGLKDIIEG